MPDGARVSYPRDIDDITDVELVAEIVRRNRLRKEGRCDYCKAQARVTNPCGYPERHLAAQLREYIKVPESRP